MKFCSQGDPTVMAASSCFPDKSRGKRGSRSSAGAGDALARRAMPATRNGAWLGAGMCWILATGIPAGNFVLGVGFAKVLRVSWQERVISWCYLSWPSLAQHSFCERRRESCQEWDGLQESPVATGFNRGAALPANRMRAFCLSGFLRQHLSLSDVSVPLRQII